jgi:predicted DNA-binding transcriptional regulator AlpA
MEANKNLLALAKEVPNITISVTLSDLYEFGEELVRKSKQQLEQLLQDEATEKYLSIEKTAELLEINKSSLWRWDKQNYLKPISIGGKRRYKMSDIKRILEG